MSSRVAAWMLRCWTLVLMAKRHDVMPGGETNDRVHGAVDVGLGGGPVRDRDAHEASPPPRGAAHPAGAVALDSFDHPVGASIIAESDEHLVQHHGVGDVGATGGQPVGEPTSQPTAPLDQIR